MKNLLMTTLVVAAFFGSITVKAQSFDSHSSLGKLLWPYADFGKYTSFQKDDVPPMKPIRQAKMTGSIIKTTTFKDEQGKWVTKDEMICQKQALVDVFDEINYPSGQMSLTPALICDTTFNEKTIRVFIFAYVDFQKIQRLDWNIDYTLKIAANSIGSYEVSGSDGLKIPGAYSMAASKDLETHSFVNMLIPTVNYTCEEEDDHISCHTIEPVMFSALIDIEDDAQ